MEKTFSRHLITLAILALISINCQAQRPGNAPMGGPGGTPPPMGKFDKDKAPKAEKKTKKAKAKKDDAAQPEQRATFRKDVCMFGVARSYQDSITYFTNISPIHQAVFDKDTKFMDGLNLYTDQLEHYLLEQGHSGYICATFYYPTMKKAEKAYLSLKKKIAKKSYTTVNPIGDFVYRFISPESIYRNVIPERTEDEEDTTTDENEDPSMGPVSSDK